MRNSPDVDSELARKLIETIPPLMHRVRTELRIAAATAQDTLSIPQYRILANIRRGIRQVGKIADHHGVTQPAMSKMVSGLEKKGLITRRTDASDRRRTELRLTKKGEEFFESTKRQAQAGLSGRIKGLSLSAEEKQDLLQGLLSLEAALLGTTPVAEEPA